MAKFFFRAILWTLMTVGTLSPAGRALAQSETVPYRSALAEAVRTAAQRVLPSVVSIEVVGVSQSAARGQQRSEVARDASSCGVIVDADGYVIASDIVVRRPAASILVVLADETRLAAKVVARDHHRGLVMLRIETDHSLIPLTLPESVQTPVGATVVAVGRYGSDRSPMVSSGILSATGRLEGTMLQSDARVSPSFYGGPLIDLYGNAIGILVPAVADGGAPDDTSWYDSGIAFAVPTPVLQTKLQRLREGTDIRKGLIGIVPKSKDPYAADTELAAVRSRSPAEQAGIQPGDTVKSVAGQPVTMFQEIKQALGPYDAGETIELELERDSQRRNVSVTLAETIPPLQPQRLGVWVAQDAPAAEQSDDEADDATTVPVVVRGVVPGTAAVDKLQPEDEIQKINQTEITDLATLSRLMITAVPDAELTVTIKRQGQTEQVKLTPTSVAGPALPETIKQWADQTTEDQWDVLKLRLPDVGNLAAYVAPKPDQTDSRPGLAMLMLLLPPDQRDPEQALKTWQEVASRHGVVVCAVCSEEDSRWQQNEIDVVSRMATLMSQRVPIAVTAVAAGGALDDASASAADSMVVAIALSDRKNFSGIAVSAKTKPPAVRLRENEPDRSLEILLPIESLDDGPTWLAPLKSAGYPISLGGKIEPSDLLRWVRLLQTI
ncbi:PDZ domain-containing protein [Stieleria sp. TO1_6]|uniref:S1C family serine protease n=1 Tax=Stieleria tagensis TaxID=2956795 RepID=UPI00209B609E|nr:PDZ domain-containing protein [Stieleria tagensis]MCO8120198.1 PDZ domain-containing protein [Stieleria tagensis]